MDCQFCRVRVAAYQQNLLPRDEQKKIKKHIKKCDACRQLFNQSHSGQNEEEQHTSRKSNIFKRYLLIGLGISLLAVIILVGNTSDGFDWWGDQPLAGQESLEEINQLGIGTKVMAVSESNGVEVTITHAVADNLQTVLYYQVEDLDQKRQFWIDPQLDSTVDSEENVWEKKAFDARNITRIDEEYENKGRISFPPIKESEANITIKFEKLVEMKSEETRFYGGAPERDTNKLEGEWEFEIPVKKQESIEHELNLKTEVAGIPILINKVTIAPTVTLVSYQQEVGKNRGQSHIGFDEMKTAEGSYKVDHFNYGILSGPVSQSLSNGWLEETVPFESVYFSKPNKLGLHVGQIVKQVEVDKEFPIDAEAKEPQTFEFAGSEIIVKNIELGSFTDMEVEETLTEERKFEHLRYEIRTEPEAHAVSRESEGMFVTKDGDQYKPEDLMEVEQSELENGRHYSTFTKIKLGEPDGSNAEETIIPTSLHIYSYQVTEYPDKSISIDLDN